MATPIGAGLQLLQKFDIIFPFLFIFADTLGIFGYLKAFNDNKAIHALLAIILSFMTVFSSIAVKTINKMAPWFVLFFIFILFLLLTYRLFGVPEEHIIKVLTGPEHGSTFFWWVMAIILIITLGSLSSVISEEQGFKKLTGENVTIGEQQTFFQVIFHPQVLGMVLLLLIAVFTIQQMTRAE